MPSLKGPWTLPLLAFAVLGAVSGLALSAVLEATLEAPPLVPAPLPPPLTAALPAPPSLRTLDRLLGVEAKSAPLTSAALEELLELRLLGTLLAEDGLWASLAAVETVADARAHTVAVGDLLLEAEVLRIERDRLFLRRGERTWVVTGRSTPVPARPAPSKLPLFSTLETGPGHYRFRRADVEAAMQSWGEVSRGVHVVPAFQGGRARGFKLISLPEGSVLAKLGLARGDVVERVNGQTIDSPEVALSLYAQLKTARVVEVQVARGGAVLQRRYEVLD